MPGIRLISADEEDALIRARLTNDERTLRGIIKRALALHGAAVKGDEGRQALLDGLLVELAKYAAHLERSGLVDTLLGSQEAEAMRMKREMEEERERVREGNERLKWELEEAQLDRKRKLEYDEIAREIEKLPSREESLASIATLESGIAELVSTRASQGSTFSHRYDSFLDIVSALEVLRAGVEAEAQEGRRRALLDDDAEADAGSRGGEEEEEEEGKVEDELMVEGEEGSVLGREEAGRRLNPQAREFRPGGAGGEDKKKEEAVPERRLGRDGQEMEEGEEEEELEDGEEREVAVASVEEAKKRELEEGEEDEEDAVLLLR